MRFNHVLALLIATMMSSPIVHADDLASRIQWEDFQGTSWTAPERAILKRGALKTLRDVPQCKTVVSAVAEMHFDHYTIVCNCDDISEPRNPACFSVEFTEKEASSKKPFIYRPTIAVSDDEGKKMCRDAVAKKLGSPSEIQWGLISADVAQLTQNMQVLVRGFVPAIKAYGSEWGFSGRCIIDGKYHKLELDDFSKWKL
ncbi:hypothetical protein OZ411_32845 [Bradyrhizobium sp. Arg237L]|uniref:hypothetical protein n=1 Tax=Bradyrhizobium sp. Arg237L TaxID=3003352 RepID=UPI00249F04CC|nr:hypothetical protein [Bradyrhizobium sp. Arg237L]MDI4237603.1 hypothetical protein [Bradyrhizobium sp. Arg237L]